MRIPLRFIAPFAALALMGAGCAKSSAPLATSPVSPSKVPDAVQTFGAYKTAVVIPLHQSVKYPDGLVVELRSIADSRCKTGVKCIWAGELAPTLQLRGGAFGLDSTDLTLGTVRMPTATVKSYTFKLGEMTADSATVTVSKK